MKLPFSDRGNRRLAATSEAIKGLGKKFDASTILYLAFVMTPG